MNRRPSLLAAVVGLVAAALLAGGCGSSSKAKPAASSTATTPSLTADLQIVLYPGFVSNPQTKTYHLTCSPDGGTVPDPAAACQRLAADRSILDDAPTCQVTISDIGSQAVTGTVGGTPVDLKYVGCPRDIARWKRVSSAVGLTP